MSVMLTVCTEALRRTAGVVLYYHPGDSRSTRPISSAEAWGPSFASSGLCIDPLFLRHSCLNMTSKSS